MGAIKDFLFRLRFRLRPLSPEADALMQRVGRDGMDLSSTTMADLPALIELLDRGLIKVYESDDPLDKAP